MHAEDGIREGITNLFNFIIGHEEEGGDAVVDMIMQVIEQSDLGRELRTLRWKVKTLGKQNGKQGQAIYDMRCRLAEAQHLCTFDRSTFRSVRDQLRAALARVSDQNEEIRDLQLMVRDQNAEIRELHAELGGDTQPALRVESDKTRC